MRLQLPRWTIRGILLAVFLTLAVALGAVSHWVLVPRVLQVMTAAQTRAVSQQVDVIIDAVEPFLLSRQYAAVIETLETVEARNENWVALSFAFRNGQQLYPLFPKELDRPAHAIEIARTVVLRGHELGTLYATVDNTAVIARLHAEVERTITLAGIALTVLILGLILLVDRFLARPVRTLAHAADRMAEGDFERPLRNSRIAEVRLLVDSFAKMRARIRHQTVDLNRAREEAEAALVTKSQFLARMSHEIRTPLNGVIPVAEFLSETRLTEEQSYHVDTIRESGKALLSIVDDILDLAKLEQGKMEILPAPFCLSDLVSTVLRILRVGAEKKGLCLRGEVAPEIAGAWYAGDHDRLRQILINLVGNAIKFTEKGSVTVQIAPGPDGAGVTIAVIDTGIGIAEADRDRIFESFEQAEGGRQRRFGGTGLGLAITRALVEAQGGRLSVESTPGEGSRFEIALPLATCRATGDAAEPDESAAPGGAGGQRALVVDDNRTNRFVAKTMLQRIGYRVEIAANGQEALGALQAGGFDIVLMDMHMPDMDGLEATRRIRALDAPSGTVRIVALTASVLEEDKIRCREAGMDGFVSKPLSLKALRATLAA